ncbi:MAG TPA: hypothetical protein VIK04_13700 [Solirubrobacteraceae bacterium]
MPALLGRAALVPDVALEPLIALLSAEENVIDAVPAGALAAVVVAVDDGDGGVKAVCRPEISEVICEIREATSM